MSIFASRPDPARLERLAALERQVQPGIDVYKSFAASGQALAAIRDEKLFSHKWATFGQYVTARWNITERHALRLIDAAGILQQLGDQAEHITSEKQARVLGQVPPGHRGEVVSQAASEPEGLTLASLEEAAAPHMKRRRRKARAPKRITYKGKGWKITIERKNEAIDPIMILRDALSRIEVLTKNEAA